jgi:hypothetical protein
MMSLCSLSDSASAQVRLRAQTIKDRMRDVSALVGSWEATYAFHSGQGLGHDTQEVGTQVVTWALDSTYLKSETERHRSDDPHSRRLQLWLLTWNPDSSRYEQSYFYSGSPLKVFEFGEYSAERREFSTRAFIPLEDGVRNEHVRTVTHIRSSDEITYEHYSRYSDEAVERNDLTITFRRVKTPKRTDSTK